MAEKIGAAFHVSRVGVSSQFGGDTFTIKAHFHTREQAELAKQLLETETLKLLPRDSDLVLLAERHAIRSLTNGSESRCVRTRGVDLPDWSTTMNTLTKAASDVLAERQRQISAEGWTPAHDDQHADGSMALAAACYAMFASVSDEAREATDLPGELTTTGRNIHGWSAWLEIWPWARSWWKPKDRRRDLVRAAALLLAEIERLDRAALRERLSGSHQEPPHG